MSEQPKRQDFGSVLMRETSRGPVDIWLRKRANWMIDQVGIEELMESKIWPDKTHPRRVEVLCLGAGKGHEMETIQERLPNSFVTGVDPNDHYAPEVLKRVEQKGNDVIYLHESVRAEDLRGLPGVTQDAVTLFFVLHHMDKLTQEAVMREVVRVLKPDGLLFIAEDLVDDLQEQKITEAIDRRINLEIVEGPHEYRDTEGWKVFFRNFGFEMVRAWEVKPDKVRHGFFALRRLPS
ncbi:class I SAM-dependent methyltransferase [Candidatus Uhrbacteria bacterium]|nr:class I SAM-dependent methyltransferase [Candidatus Uhrbacteria bacterium]